MWRQLWRLMSLKCTQTLVFFRKYLKFYINACWKSTSLSPFSQDIKLYRTKLNWAIDVLWWVVKRNIENSCGLTILNFAQCLFSWQIVNLHGLKVAKWSEIFFFLPGVLRNHGVMVKFFLFQNMRILVSIER